MSAAPIAQPSPSSDAAPTAKIFWGELAPCMHAVQIYASDDVFVRTLEAFVREGLTVGDATIVIATPAHLESLEFLLMRHGVDLERARTQGTYIARDADTTLREFMVSGWPDRGLFEAFVHRLLEAARGTASRRVRAFGEMVAILWSRGQDGPAGALEALWDDMCLSERFALFCAYPRDGFGRNPVESMVHICQLHSKVVPSIPEL